MLKNYSRFIIGLLAGIVLGLLVGKQIFEKKADQNKPVAVIVPGVTPAASTEPAAAGNKQPDENIPRKVYEVLNYIRANNQPMPGYVGGRIFSNREELLPWEDGRGKPVLYHEWDVNIKMAGQNRGTERLITGSDGRAWYTNDHYQSFKEIK